MELVQSVEKCIQVVAQKQKSVPALSMLQGVGITNQRETTLLWDKTTGHYLYNAICGCSSSSPPPPPPPSPPPPSPPYI